MKFKLLIILLVLFGTMFITYKNEYKHKETNKEQITVKETIESEVINNESNIEPITENIKDNKLAQALASSGFRDTTRLALSNTQMAHDMVELNQENIQNAYNSFKACFNDIVNNNYKQNADRIKEFRKNLYN